MLKLDNRAARRLFLDRHGLGEAPGGPGHGAALEAVIGRLGFVQLDSINTVARAHALILFARRPRYRPENLGRLVEGRALFEHWTHDAAVIPMAFYPAWALKRRRDAARLAQRYRVWQRHEFQTEFDRVLAMIRERGPVCSNDLGPDTPRKAGGLGLIFTDMVMRVAVFILLHAVIYVASADWFGSFGGSKGTALRVVAPTLARSALFDNISGVYLYAVLLGALPIYAAALSWGQTSAPRARAWLAAAICCGLLALALTLVARGLVQMQSG